MTEFSNISSKFRALLMRNGVNPSSAKAEWNYIRGRYSEPHRFHHTINHIQEIFQELKPFDISDAIALAVFYHDISYDTENPADNEWTSSLLCANLINLGARSEVVNQAQLIISTTKDHIITTERIKDDINVELFLDADMAILGALPKRYRKYATDIRKEYAHVPDELFYKGRLDFLNKTLDREHIFLTDYFRSKKEAQARINMITEFALLKADTTPSF